MQKLKSKIKKIYVTKINTLNNNDKIWLLWYRLKQFILLKIWFLLISLYICLR